MKKIGIPIDRATDAACATSANWNRCASARPDSRQSAVLWRPLRSGWHTHEHRLASPSQQSASAQAAQRAGGEHENESAGCERTLMPYPLIFFAART
jgi:hypothetical protein